MSIPPLILASASPARLRLLQNAGINPLVCASNFDESQIEINDPDTFVQVLAQRKAETVATQFHTGLILGCDSILVVNGQIYGKPAHADDAIARWQKMCGQIGALYTGHALIDIIPGKTLVQTQVTQVYFATLSDRQIKAYVGSQEPLKCAGCFALEGRGGLFVEKIVGCHSNVIGLSLPLLRVMLKELGYDILDFWE